MTSLPKRPPERKLGLVIDLSLCVGCHACAVHCKEWNASGLMAPLTDTEPYGVAPDGVWFNRVHAFEVETEEGAGTVYFPQSCLHCDDAPWVTACQTGASWKRGEDSSVLIDEDKCIGCKLCSWACPYGAREYDGDAGVMKKCTLCVDRIYNENLPPESRAPACVVTCPTGARSFGDLADRDSAVGKLATDKRARDLMPGQGTRPVNKYLMPTLPPKRLAAKATPKVDEAPPEGLFLRWVDKILSR